MKRLSIGLALCFGLFSACAGFAADIGSTNFKNKDSTFEPATFSATSPSFKINGSIDPTVGAANSAGFSVFSGVPLPLPSGPTAPAPSPSVSGGGGSGASAEYVAPPTLTYRSPTFLAHQHVGGTRGSADTTIWLNASPDGVSYPSDRTWERDLPLFLGVNGILVVGKIPSGYTTPSIGGEIERLLIGDVNRDRVVDDRDLSLFIRAWRRFTPFADFNEDARIDDHDLSLLASHWGMRS